MKPLILLLLVMACVAPKNNNQIRGSETVRMVTGMRAWHNQHDIDEGLKHLFEGEVVGPYYVAFSNDFVCRVTPEVFVMLQYRQNLSCQWRLSRGHSSVGRTFRWQRKGRGFDSHWLHSTT